MLYTVLIHFLTWQATQKSLVKQNSFSCTHMMCLTFTTVTQKAKRVTKYININTILTTICSNKVGILCSLCLHIYTQVTSTTSPFVSLTYSMHRIKVSLKNLEQTLLYCLLVQIRNNSFFLIHNPMANTTHRAIVRKFISLVYLLCTYLNCLLACTEIPLYFLDFLFVSWVTTLCFYLLVTQS